MTEMLLSMCVGDFGRGPVHLIIISYGNQSGTLVGRDSLGSQATSDEAPN